MINESYKTRPSKSNLKYSEFQAVDLSVEVNFIAIDSYFLSTFYGPSCLKKEIYIWILLYWLIEARFMKNDKSITKLRNAQLRDGKLEWYNLIHII